MLKSMESRIRNIIYCFQCYYFPSFIQTHVYCFAIVRHDYFIRGNNYHFIPLDMTGQRKWEDPSILCPQQIHVSDWSSTVWKACMTYDSPDFSP